MERILDKRDPVFRFHLQEMRPIRFSKLRLLNGANQLPSHYHVTSGLQHWRPQHEMSKNHVYVDGTTLSHDIRQMVEMIGVIKGFPVSTTPNRRSTERRT